MICFAHRQLSHGQICAVQTSKQHLCCLVGLILNEPVMKPSVRSFNLSSVLQWYLIDTAQACANELGFGPQFRFQSCNGIITPREGLLLSSKLLQALACPPYVCPHTC